MTVGALERGAWDGYLLPALLPEAVRLHVGLDADAATVAASLPADCTAVAFHLDPTDAPAYRSVRTGLQTTLEERGVAALNARADERTADSLHESCAFRGLGSTAPGVELRSRRTVRVTFAGSRCCVTATSTLPGAAGARTWRSDESEFAHVGCAELPAALQLAVVRLIAHYRLDFGAFAFVEDERGCMHAADLDPLPRWSEADDCGREHLRAGLLERIADAGAVRDRRTASAAFAVDEYVRAVLARAEPLVSAKRQPWPRPLGEAASFAIRLARHHLIRIVRAVMCRAALCLARLSKLRP